MTRKRVSLRETPGFATHKSATLTASRSERISFAIVAPKSRFPTSLHARTYLALGDDRAAPSAKIAASLGTNRVEIRRLPAVLVEGDLAYTFKGADGGFTPTRPPAEIGLLDVYRSVETSPEQGLVCLVNPHRPDGSRIGGLLRAIFAGAQAGMERELARTLLADAGRELRPTCPERRKR
jgi:DNA-binding IscR family transcriptional regulator